MLLIGNEGRPRAAIDAALFGAASLNVNSAREFRHHHLAVEEDVEACCRITFPADRAGLDDGDVAVLAQRLQLCIVQGLEEEQRPQFVR